MNKAHNLFISWSGERSRAAAEFLHKWLPKVVQGVKPWLSSEDIDKGSRSQDEMATALQGIKVGIICLTSDNVREPWILFEAGALSKTIDDRTRLCTYLLGGLQPKDIEAPLGLFQATKAEKEDTRKLLHTINSAVSDEPICKDDLNDVFDAMWPKLRDTLDRLPPGGSQVQAKRTIDDMLAEILELTRAAAISRHMPSASSSRLKFRGRWGELTLRRVVEMAGMSEHCDFSGQETISTESGRQRPDMIVNLPGNRRIAVDAKVPLQAFLDAANPQKSEEERAKALATHGELVRDHMNQLAERKYWEQVGPKLDLVVLFLPGESFFSAALEQDRQLIDDGMQKKVVLATPTTLIALLRSAAYLWQQEKITQNAKEVSDLGKELYNLVRLFLAHFKRVGESLTGVVNDYNKAVSSMESRVLPCAQKIKEVTGVTGEEVQDIGPVDESPHPPASPEQGSRE
jgi:DNA recombination protein RmuC